MYIHIERFVIVLELQFDIPNTYITAAAAAYNLQTKNMHDISCTYKHI